MGPVQLVVPRIRGDGGLTAPGKLEEVGRRPLAVGTCDDPKLSALIVDGRRIGEPQPRNRHVAKPTSSDLAPGAALSQSISEIAPWESYTVFHGEKVTVAHGLFLADQLRAGSQVVETADHAEDGLDTELVGEHDWLDMTRVLHRHVAFDVTQHLVAVHADESRLSKPTVSRNRRRWCTNARLGAGREVDAHARPPGERQSSTLLATTPRSSAQGWHPSAVSLSLVNAAGGMAAGGSGGHRLPTGCRSSPAGGQDAP